MIFVLKKILCVALAVVAIGFIGYNIYQIYFVPKACYRPMICYNNTSFWDEKIVDVSVDGLEYIGTINSSVPDGEKPDSDFECNTEVFLEAKLYRDGNDVYYLLCTNGNLLLLDTAGKGADYATVVGRDALIPPLVGAEFTGDS